MNKLNYIKRLEPLHKLGLVVMIFILSAPYTLPLIVSDFWVIVLTEIFIWGLFAASVNFLLGYCGLLSFGQAVYFGMGAYGVALGFELLGLPFWPAFFLGAMIATATAAFIGIFAVRLTWHYFAIITVVFCLIFFYLAVGWKDVTGGDDGLPFSIPPVFRVGSLEVTLFNLTFQYYFVLAIVAACFLIFHIILKSPLGHAIVAVRENAERVSLLGLSVYKLKYIAFIISGFFAGVAGVLFALFSRYATAHDFFWHLSGEAVLWTIIGGVGTLFGPVLGAGLLIIVREELSVYLENYLLLVGVFIVLAVIFAPRGLMGLLINWLGRSPRSVKKEKGDIKTEVHLQREGDQI
jgi:branched-chain amino acid transport system permease protein